MSTFYNTMPQQPAPKKRRRWLTPALIGGAFIIGAGMGAAGSGAPQAAAEPAEPLPAVTVTAEPVVEQVEVEVPVTPAACLKALDSADEAFGIAAEQIGVLGDAMQAAGNFDVAGVQAAGPKIEALTAELNAISPDHNLQKAACRASAQ